MYRLKKQGRPSVLNECGYGENYLVCESLRGKIYTTLYPLTKRLHPNIGY